MSYILALLLGLFLILLSNILRRKVLEMKLREAMDTVLRSGLDITLKGVYLSGPKKEGEPASLLSFLDRSHPTGSEEKLPTTQDAITRFLELTGHEAAYSGTD